MIETRPFSFDRATGIRTLWQYDHDTGAETFIKSQDAEPLVEDNKAELLNTADHWRGEMHKVASIPLHVYMELRALGVVQDPKRFKAWLNDRDNAAFRTRAGRV